MTAAPVLPSPGSALPPHVRSAFGVAEVEPRPVVWAGRRAWRCGELLLRPVPDKVVAAWSAGVLDGLKVDGLRIAQPVRSSDGRWVVGGWAANRFIAGTVEPRYDAVLTAAVRLHEALSGIERPRLLDGRDDLAARSAAAAFGERRATLDADTGGTLFTQLAAYRAPVQLTPQLVHPELFGSVLFDDRGVPALIELVPCWRPAQWAAAVVVVDAIAWGGGDQGLLQRWADSEAWPQSLLRAVLFRLALHAQHPEASARTLEGLERAAGLVSALL
ncbi:MAG TPA: TIGR02569 family protein [Pseudonocardia sp.]|nr:TIGR02569 family protein [Pseudonocardia sp.]